MVRSSSPSSRRRSRFIVATLVMVVGLVMLVIGVQAQSDSGRYAQVQGSLNCAGMLSWQVSLPPPSASASSTAATAQQVGHDNVELQYRVGTDDWVVAETVALQPDNHFIASGSLDVTAAIESNVESSGQPAASVDLQVVPLGPWSDGATNNQPRFSQIRVPEHCGTHPIDVDLTPQCSINAVDVHLHHVGNSTAEEIEVRLELDGAALRVVTINPSEDHKLSLPMQPGLTRELVVTAVNGPSLFREQISLDCSDSAALIAPVVMVEYCPQARGEFMFTLPGDYDVRLDNAAVQTISVPNTAQDANGTAEGVLHRSHVVLPDERNGLFLEVIHDDTVVLSGLLDDCTGDAMGISTVAAGPSNDEPTGVIPTIPDPSDAAEPLPETGLSTLGIITVLSGTMLMLGGAWLWLVEFRRPRPAVLGPALAPYSKTWWDEENR